MPGRRGAHHLPQGGEVNVDGGGHLNPTGSLFEAVWRRELQPRAALPRHSKTHAHGTRLPGLGGRDHFADLNAIGVEGEFGCEEFFGNLGGGVAYVEGDGVVVTWLYMVDAHGDLVGVAGHEYGGFVPHGFGFGGVWGPEDGDDRQLWSNLDINSVHTKPHSHVWWLIVTAIGARADSNTANTTMPCDWANITNMTPPSSTPNSRPVVGALLVCGSCISLQFGAALAVLLFPLIGAWATTLCRLFIAGLILTVILRPRVHRWSREQWISVALFGLSLGTMNAFFYAGIARIPLGTAVTIEFIGPLALAAILSRSLRDALWVGLAVLGIGLFGVEKFLGLSELDPAGVLCVLAAGVFWALYILAAGNAGKKVPGTGSIAIAMLFGSLPSLPLGAADVPTVFLDVKLLGLAVGTAIFASLVPYTLEFLALRRVSAGVFGILMSMEPAVAALAGWLLLDQHMGVLGIVAVCLVVSACLGTTASKS